MIPPALAYIFPSLFSQPVLPPNFVRVHPGQAITVTATDRQHTVRGKAQDGSLLVALFCSGTRTLTMLHLLPGCTLQVIQNHIISFQTSCALNSGPHRVALVGGKKGVSESLVANVRAACFEAALPILHSDLYCDDPQTLEFNARTGLLSRGDV